MADARVLIVDDDAVIRSTLSSILEMHGFAVTTAADVLEALHYISTHEYDVLLSDLHMPGAGDGLTVASAMRHANPEAVTMLLSAFPEMTSAVNAILRQADEVLLKPVKVPDLIESIHQRLAKGPLHRRIIESLATIVGRTKDEIIDHWYARVQTEVALAVIVLTREERCRHLPQLLVDLIKRLQSSKPLGTKELPSDSAMRHGQLRRQQQYTAAMIVEESRILQVTLFETLQNNLQTIDFSILLTGVMTIADEVDSQLSQAMKSYIGEEAGSPASA